MNDNLNVVDTNSVQELIDKLQELSNENDPLKDKGWYFRGQADSTWKLLPSALRKDGKQLIKEIARVFNDELKNETNIYPHLRIAIGAYLWYLDKNDLHIDGYNNENKETYYYKDPKYPPRGVRYDWWNKNGIEPCFDHIALAQHYGIPTTFLDWTRSYRKALFFAVNPEPPKDAKKIAVWAHFYDPEYRGEYHEFINPPRGNNTCLRAQEGIFTLQNSVDVREGITFENSKYFTDHVKISDQNGHKHIEKYTLPVSEVEKLEAKLNEWGITRETMFPEPYERIRAITKEFVEEIRKRTSKK